MTRKLIILILTIIIFIGCSNNNQEINRTANDIAKEKEVHQKTSKLTDDKTNPKRIGDYMSDTTDFFWCAKQSDTASYLIRIVFQKEFAVYQFHGQCI
jgi:nitrous oxide reductase accessory protein NosL